MEMSIVTAPGAGIETIWMFDFDGTISEFVPSPGEAEIHPACRDLIRDLAARPFQRVAILSSRLLDDVVRRVHIPGVYLGGGNGMEWMRPGGGSRGKRRGLRVIYYWQTAEERFWMLLVYPQSERDDLSAEQLRQMRILVKEFLV